MTEYGRERPEATTVLAPVAGSTLSTLPAPFSTTRSEPLGSTATEVGLSNASGSTRRRTVTAPSREDEPPARALRVQRPGLGKTSRARYDAVLPARTHRSFDPARSQ